MPLGCQLTETQAFTGGPTGSFTYQYDGAPLFCVTKPIDSGLQKTLEDDIVPRLLEALPGQPTSTELAVRPLLHRFTVVFGWSSNCTAKATPPTTR